MRASEKEKLEEFRKKLKEILKDNNLKLKNKKRTDLLIIENSTEFVHNNKRFLLIRDYEKGNLIFKIEELLKYTSFFLNTLNLTYRDFVFIDIETCGTSENTVILIGTLIFDNEEPTIIQAFARDYSEECAILEYISHLLEGRKIFITYNGKHFDLPIMRLRSLLYYLEPPEPHIHIDLLPIARKRIPKKRLPNRRLITLEYYLLGFERVGDVPNRLIPEIYHNFVRNGDASGIIKVIQHNAWDVLSMANLMPILLSVDSPKIDNIKRYWYLDK
ncbi:MAG: ribonuclease H-like domain-containing protein [bacterium]